MQSINFFFQPLWIEQKLSFCKEKNVTNTLCLVVVYVFPLVLFFYFFFLSLCFCSWALLLTHLVIFRRQPWKCFLDSFHGFIQKLVSFGFSFLLRQFHLSTSFESIWNLILSYQKKKRMKTWIKLGKIFRDRGAHAWNSSLVDVYIP